MEFNTKQELYDYLNSFDFDAVRDTKLSSVYFLVEFNNRIEPIHFMKFEDVWFPSACELFKIDLENDKIMDYVKALYIKEYWDDAYEYEKTMQRDDCHYEIVCFQCEPFLPDNIKILATFSDAVCLKYLLDRTNTQVTKNKNNI